MPVRINEVIIRIVVEDPSTISDTPVSVPVEQMKSFSEQEIANRILEILKEKNER